MNERLTSKALTFTVGAGATVKSDPIAIGALQPLGMFSLQVVVTGDGTAKIEYELSNYETTAVAGSFVTPSDADDIATGLTKTSGSGGDGKDFLSFSPKVCQNMKIKVTETGEANPVVVTAMLVTQ